MKGPKEARELREPRRLKETLNGLTDDLELRRGKGVAPGCAFCWSIEVSREEPKDTTV